MELQSIPLVVWSSFISARSIFPADRWISRLQDRFVYLNWIWLEPHASIISHGFCWSRIREGLSWMVLPRGLLMVLEQCRAAPAGFTEASLSLRTSLGFLTDGSLQVFRLFIRWLKIPRVKPSQTARHKSRHFFWLAVRSHACYFHHILIVASKYKPTRLW